MMVVGASCSGKERVARQGPLAIAGSFKLVIERSFSSRMWCSVGRGCPEGGGALQELAEQRQVISSGWW